MQRNLAHQIINTFIYLSLLLSAGCSTSAPQQLKHLLDTYHWQSQIIETDAFNFMSYAPSQTSASSSNHEQLIVYLEGDGNAWQTRHRISENPTPTNPTALKLATQSKRSNVVYLARPCQYLEPPFFKNCTASTWTQARFSEPVINAMHQAIVQLKKQYQASTLTLVGYSGGGTLAMMIAARESSVTQLITVAAPLDPLAWTELHQVSALDVKATTALDFERLSQIPQLHFTGEKDSIVPMQLVQDFIDRYPTQHSANVRVIEITDADHNCCWVQNWRELSDTYQLNLNN